MAESENRKSPPIDESSPLLKDTAQQEELDESRQRATRRITQRITVEPVIVLYFLAFAPLVPLNEQYFYQQIAERHNFSTVKNDSSECIINVNSTQYKNEELVQSESTQWLLFNNLAGLIPASVVIILLGPYSDQRGRKIAILLPLIGAVGKLCISSIIVGLHLPFELILVGSFLEGTSGGIMSLLMACFAYISDISTKEKRAKRIFILECCIGVAIVASEVGMGYAIKELGYFYPYIIVLTCFVLVFIYALFAVPESLIAQEGVRFFTTVNMKKTINLYIVDDENRRRWKLQLSTLIFLMISAIDTGNMDIVTGKLLKSPLCFTSILIGYFVSMSYSVRFVLGAVTLKLTYRWLREMRTITLGCLSNVAYNLLFPFASTKPFAFLSTITLFAGSLPSPMIRAYTSKLVKPREQGTIMAAIAWTQSVGSMIGNITLNSIYSATVNLHGGITAFFVSAGFYLIAAIIASIILTVTRREKKRTVSMVDNSERDDN